QPADAERAKLALDVDAVARPELAAQGVRHEVQGGFVHRAAVDAVQGPGVGVAVFLETPLEQDHHARLAARGRPEQQQQAPANLRAGARGLEVVDYPLDGVVDPVKFVLEELTAEPTLAVVEALGPHHVPHVLMAGAGEAARVVREDLLEEAGESSLPVGRAVLLGEIVQRPEEARLALVVAVVEARYRIVHDATFQELAVPLLRWITFPRVRSTTKQ